MKGSANRLSRIPCAGCPIYPHIPDEQFRFPSCELCHWPAIGVGPTHAWRCAYCRHWNRHGELRPRVNAVLLRLAGIDPAARLLEVVDVRCGRHLFPRVRPIGRSRLAWRPDLSPPPVLIVGGDRHYPYPLGLAEHDPEPCAFGSRATRIACPCDQPAPCLHGQALYAHVVTPIAAPPAAEPGRSGPARAPAPAVRPLALSGSAR
jgi:hypothetical protein